MQATTRILRNVQPTTSSSAPKSTPKRYSKRQERRIKKRRVEECAAALSWLEEDGLTPVKITVVNSQTQQLESITLKEDIEKALGIQGEDMTQKDQDIVSMMLYVKDRYHISASAYHEMASLCRQMPRHYRLKQRISELNAQWNINPTGLWRELLKINHLLSVRPHEVTELTATQFEERSKEFVRTFTDIYPAKHVTPYMHCMMMHVSEFMQIHGALLPFTQHGLEKYNDCMTKDYFRSSSHRGQECLTDYAKTKPH